MKIFSPVKIQKNIGIYPKTPSKLRTNKLNLFPSQSLTIESIFSLDKKITTSILIFLEYKEIQQLQRLNKNIHSSLTNKKILRNYALSGVISKENRILFYESQINVKKLKSTLLKELQGYKITSNIYSNILKKALELKDKDEKLMKAVEDISLDINRTFYTDKFKNGNGKTMLNNILISLAFIRPEIGYCQGMNFIVGALINFIDNEEKCFWIFLSFIDNIELNYLYLNNMLDYSIRVFQLNYYIKENFPELFNHLKRKQINPDIIFSKWILTIFSNFLPFNVLYNIWDVFILDKWKAIFKFSLILANYMKDKLSKMDLIELSNYMKKINNNMSELNFGEMCKFYEKYKITNKKLKELREDFFIEQIKIKLDSNDTEWETDQSDYVNNYHNEIKEINNNIKKDVEKLKEQIYKANLDFERKVKKYQEYLDLVNQLKIKIGSKIEEKTSYENALKRYLNNQKKNNLFISLDNDNLSNKSQGKKKINGKLNSALGTRLSLHFKKIIKGDKNEKVKLENKIKALEKEIKIHNKSLFVEIEKLDKKKYVVEKAEEMKNNLQKQLDEIINSSEKAKRESIKNLSEKLKLSEKFVLTNHY